MAKKVRCLLILLPLALDCAGSWVIGESFSNTLSAKAWDARTHPRWGWTHNFIDGMPWFGAGHCEAQWKREQHGSVWKAWAADWRGDPFPPITQPQV